MTEIDHPLIRRRRAASGSLPLLPILLRLVRGRRSVLTLRTLAMSLNLSTSPVSPVLDASAGAERIPAVTRERILAAARGLHVVQTFAPSPCADVDHSPSGCWCPTAYTPRLTTVRVPSQQAGERAAQMIVGRIESGTAQLGDRSSRLNAVFSVRESTGVAISRARNGAS